MHNELLKKRGLLFSASAGVIAGAMAIASGVAPMLFAYIFDETASYDLGFLIATGFFAVGALLLLSLGKYPNRQNQ